MERELGRELSLHGVRRVMEVGARAANELLEAGWVLHDIYFSTDVDYRSNYIMLAFDEPACPACGASAKVELVDEGRRVRFVCSQECAFPSWDPLVEHIAGR